MISDKYSSKIFIPGDFRLRFEGYFKLLDFNHTAISDLCFNDLGNRLNNETEGLKIDRLE